MPKTPFGLHLPEPDPEVPKGWKWNEDRNLFVPEDYDLTPPMTEEEIKEDFRSVFGFFDNGYPFRRPPVDKNERPSYSYNPWKNLPDKPWYGDLLDNGG